MQPEMPADMPITPWTTLMITQTLLIIVGLKASRSISYIIHNLWPAECQTKIHSRENLYICFDVLKSLVIIYSLSLITRVTLIGWVINTNEISHKSAVFNYM